jgi:3D (Asp-Asp-Asp) domain-containing protein
MLVTAYDLSYESCKKYPGDPAYGITASGEPVKDWYTAAGCPMLPFGTVVYIPDLSEYPNHGVFVIEDRGSAVVDNQEDYHLPCLDIFIRDHKDMKAFGCQKLQIYVLNWGEQND